MSYAIEQDTPYIFQPQMDCWALAFLAGCITLDKEWFTCPYVLQITMNCIYNDLRGAANFGSLPAINFLS